MTREKTPGMQVRGTLVMPTEHGATLLQPRAGWGVLVWWFAIVGAAALGAAFAAGNVRETFDLLQPPSWALRVDVLDMGWVAWYFLTGMSAWLVVRRVGWRRARALVKLLIVVTVLQLLWAPTLFGLRWGGLAAALAVVVCAASVLLLRATQRFHQQAGWLLMPGVAWVFYVALVTGVLWHMNPQVL